MSLNFIKMDHAIQRTDSSSSSSSSESSFDCDSLRNLNKTCTLCGKPMLSEVCFCSIKKKLQCEICKNLFSELVDFRNHIKDHMKPKCCKNEISSDRGNTVPVNVHNVNNTLVKIVSSEKKCPVPIKIPQNCVKCGETFESKLSLMAHSLCHTDKEMETRMCRCDKCGREFPSFRRLSIHFSRMHVKSKNYRCNVCRKGFSTLATLEAHKKLHLGIKPYKCDECGKAYSQSGNLAYHKSTHTGIKPFICHLCGKAFMTAGILTNHERRHSDLKPFVCDICGRAFSDNYSMTNHKIAHTGVRSYMCDCCGKAFVHKHTLQSHKRIHSGEKKYKCTICERAFTQLSTMIQHRNTHTGEKSYLCPCGKSFTQQSSLARHKRLHEGINDLFSCRMCNKKFGYKSTLYKHHRRAHGVNEDHTLYTRKHLNSSVPFPSV